MAAFRKLRSINAFSLIQLMVALVLVAVIGVITLFVIRQFGKTGQIERAKQELVNTENNMKVALSRDLDLAIRADGASSNFLMGIQNPDDPPDASELYDRVVILAEAFGEYSFPVDVMAGASPIEKIDEFFSSNPDHEAFAINVLGKAPYLSISNIDSTNLLKRDPSQLPGAENFVPDPAYGYDFVDYQGRSNMAYPVRRMEYFVNEATKTLFRQVDDEAPEVIAQGVERFVLRYVFAKREGDPASLVIPNEALRHIEDPNYVGIECSQGVNCVGWGNIESVYVDLTLSGEKVGSSEEVNTQLSSFHISPEGQLVYNAANTFYPARFSLTAGVAQQEGEMVGCTNPATGEPLLTARCKEECVDVFTSSAWPPTPNWIGYGRYVGHEEGASDYCKCSTNPSSGDVQVPPTGIPVWPGWTDSPPPSAANKERLDACFNFYGCNSEWIKEHNNVAYFMCSCVQPLDEFLPVQPVPGQEAWAKRYDFSELEDDLESATGLADLDAAFQKPGAISGGNKRCQWWRMCDRSLKNWMKVSHGLSWSPPVGWQTWLDKCSCLAFNESPTGEVTAVGAQKNWYRRCNKEFREGGTQACADTWVGDAATGGYLLRSETNPQSLSLSEAALCECFFDDHARVWNGSADQDFNGDWGGLGNFYNFRGPDALPPALAAMDLSDLSGYDTTFKASKNSQSVDFDTYDDASGAATLRSGMQCDAVYCDNMNGFGCCSSIAFPDPATVGVQATYADYAGYCSNKCTSHNEKQQTERDRIRDIIRVPGSALCGGSGAGGGGYELQSP